MDLTTSLTVTTADDVRRDDFEAECVCCKEPAQFLSRYCKDCDAFVAFYTRKMEAELAKQRREALQIVRPAPRLNELPIPRVQMGLVNLERVQMGLVNLEREQTSLTWKHYLAAAFALGYIGCLLVNRFLL